jgi:hypothetical protein
MKRVLVSATLVGAAALLLSGCAYDPYWDGPGYGYGPGLSPRQYAKMNDPGWCNAHPQRCADLHARAGAAPPPGYGPPPGYNGPPPGYDGPPPQGDNGPPPGYNGPPPGYNGPPPQGANGPPQQMQPPPQQ